MNSSLSFRKESIQRSSSQSESLNRGFEAQGPGTTREQRPISITVIWTLTQQ